MPDDAALARRLLGLLDLTNLEANCGPAEIKALCARAVGPHGKVAAVCVWPQFAGDAARALKDTGVHVATVVNFPAGGEDVERVLDDMGEALGDGADEIDLVLPYRAFLRGDAAVAGDMVREARQMLAPRQRLKVILETGAFPDRDAIAAASRLAIEAGADFLKTSTGKIAVSATPEAAETMLTAIRDSGRPVGFKAAGGIRTLADGALYLELAERVMGAGWATPDMFRIGASSLHAALVAAIDGAADAPGGEGY
ncbi:deoxyribose-phosphate aldolase [Alsobacter sp. SYSU M60028]|uniref:Deoxyribose-phosphate aldolase n=1 Tax=Alsobacter ponti TaxID=2962936 RepID=A0ABT1L9D2_9HYPH|nr:deoxyribose-phosphate aldolase [Alsobacter ponti]MCP8938095.1 deoxyribose-phosphate aldolase [Alsobacter ponti]